MTLVGGYEGKLYRALNPIWAKKPLSGEGAAKWGGRFNPLGVPALYCALSPLTALKEAHQVGDLQPTTLVSLDASIEKVFDGRSDQFLSQYGMTPARLASTSWRDDMLRDGEADTQTFARALIAAGYSGMLAPSFARGAGKEDMNLVLLKWGSRAPHKLRLIDDESRLGR